ncbi:formylglycine-generating enzyme family protein [Nocardia sp. NBC_00565]|uniref:formylglycine-generating enzyme family protein n=1 Tax=Nocardia sp. NBC_00565 TaxID=2975993 RepID=UPI002E7FBBBB|nr:SUMF1/EgtB/PvdO family nonheme iron enzyme [Nocardia sp. NBC_00565]WUC06205.1 formylglycine-generating enzyme family protein [Nocardia sp. NBC_00565]
MATAIRADVRRGMVRISGGDFAIGSEAFFPEERPVHRVRVVSFWIDPHPVTNAAFRRFVKQIGYVTLAERLLAAED